MKFAIILAFLGLVFGDSEPQREYILFEKVDQDLNGLLDQNEVDHIFLAFDVNHDNEVTQPEFLDDWMNKYSLGAPREAEILFNKADCNDDGHLTQADVPCVYSYFDMNNDGGVDMNEFLTQWGDLKLAPVDVVIIDQNSPPTTAIGGTPGSSDKTTVSHVSKSH